jgi:hypothetical protein
MIELKSQPAEIAFTVTVKRKDTGIEEVYQMVGSSTVEQAIALGATPKENQDGSNP